MNEEAAKRGRERERPERKGNDKRKKEGIRAQTKNKDKQREGGG